MRPTLIPHQKGPPSVRRVPPNVFGIAFGFCGLTQCWAAAGAPAAVTDAGWLLVTVIWLATLLAYGRSLIADRRWRTELEDPVFAPFTALISIVPMLLGVALARYDRVAGVTVFAVALVATVGVGGWLSGQWIISDLSLAQWHPGYFLPTVAGGLIAAAGSAALGFADLARLMLGYGLICWVVLGSILLLRLFTQPALPTPLLPTMAIELAPPVVAGAAWFGLNGARPDAVALGLAGYAMLMVLVQVRLVAVYRTVPFGPGWWAFSFSYTVAVALAIRWLALEHVPGRPVWTALLLAVTTAAVGALAGRTLGRLAHGTFLPPTLERPR